MFSSKGSPVRLAEALKRYHILSRIAAFFSKESLLHSHAAPCWLDYSSIRVEFPPLTSEMKYAILLALFGGKQTEPPSYRKEEVMSQMDSSNKPSAVASLLKK